MPFFNKLPFSLTAEQIYDNWVKYRQIVNERLSNSVFPDRLEKINIMYDAIEDRISDAPASGTEHYHNAFPGGYIEHVLRVVQFTEMEHKIWSTLGFVTDNFTAEERDFAALHHDIGKLGLPMKDHEVYVPNESEWHFKAQGKVYESNPNIPFSLVQDASLFILNHYGIQMTYNEWYSIRVHDGVYDKANEGYYINNSIGSKFRTNLPMILHMADSKAARWEFERWAKASGKFKFYQGQ